MPSDSPTVPTMSFDGSYGPSTWDWVADQVEEYEASGGTRANTLRDTGIPIIVMVSDIKRTKDLICDYGGCCADTVRRCCA